jgi:hypothetical protein
MHKDASTLIQNFYPKRGVTLVQRCGTKCEIKNFPMYVAKYITHIADLCCYLPYSFRIYGQTFLMKVQK